MQELHINEAAAIRNANRVFVHDGSQYREAKRIFIHDGNSWVESFRNMLVHTIYPTINGSVASDNGQLTYCSGYFYTICRFIYSLSPTVRHYGIFQLNTSTWEWSLIYDLGVNNPYISCEESGVMYLTLDVSGTYKAYSYYGGTLTFLKDLPSGVRTYIVCGGTIYPTGYRWNGSAWVSIGTPSGMTSMWEMYNVAGTLYASWKNSSTYYSGLYQWGGSSWSIVGNTIPGEQFGKPRYFLVGGTWYAIGFRYDVKYLSGGAWTDVPNSGSGSEVAYSDGFVCGVSIFFRRWNYRNQYALGMCEFNTYTGVFSTISTLPYPFCNPVWTYSDMNNHTEKYGGKFIMQDTGDDTYFHGYLFWDGPLT
jgi:hypothetical protein